jgi:hypothetical protein
LYWWTRGKVLLHRLHPWYWPDFGPCLCITIDQGNDI